MVYARESINIAQIGGGVEVARVRSVVVEECFNDFDEEFVGEGEEGHILGVGALSTRSASW